jgi:hypothetical protein
MDFYAVLRVPSTAKQIDIDRAYQKMVKEAKYDPTINIKDVEIAYKILTDATQRALYDASMADKGKKKVFPTSVRKLVPRKEQTRPLIMIALALFVIAVAYFVFRFGYMLKNFEQGDMLYWKENDQYFGTVVAGEKDHNFGGRPAD